MAAKNSETNETAAIRPEEYQRRVLLNDQLPEVLACHDRCVKRGWLDRVVFVCDVLDEFARRVAESAHGADRVRTAYEEALRNKHPLVACVGIPRIAALDMCKDGAPQLATVAATPIANDEICIVVLSAMGSYCLRLDAAMVERIRAGEVKGFAVPPAMDEISLFIADVTAFLDNAKIPEAKDHDALMAIGFSGATHLLQLGRLCVSIAPPSGRGYSRRNAPLVGLMVRMVKLFEGVLHELAEHRQELAEVFVRPFFESQIKLEYLMRKGPGSAKSFIQTSFRAEREMLAHLRSVQKVRKLEPIEKRMIASIKNHLRVAGLRESEFLTQKTWELDGKNMRALLNDLQMDLRYSFHFGVSSHAVHGTWYDCFVHQLNRDGRSYAPKVNYTEPTPRTIAPLAGLLARQLDLFVHHFRLDQTRVIRPLLRRWWQFFFDLDNAWEDVLVTDADG